MRKIVIILACFIVLAALGACGKTNKDNSVNTESNSSEAQNERHESWVIPEELEYIPQEYKQPAAQQGRLEKLTYDTWESFSYKQKSQKLTKEAWVYLPYGYTESEKYNVFYLSHGGWSNETTLMGTDSNPRPFKNVIDNAIQDGKIKPLILVLPTYNNTSSDDSGDYSLAIQLTNQFHNELVNDLIPAVESRYSTYAADTTPEGLKASRNHRGFGGFSMGSVNTWNTFRYCLDYFGYFMPMSGSYTTDGQYMADLVRQQGHTADDFFIFAASGTNDFAYSAFKAQITAMTRDAKDVFIMADNENNGIESADDKYQYSQETKYDVESGTQEYRGFVLDNVLHSETEGDIHYNVYIPDSYDGTESYALFMTLPGYQGLYFQGVGENVRTEEFGFAARQYNPKMIIVAPQLNDWQDTSARQTIALTEYFLDSYNIDRSRVYAEGYSGGGETMSRVMGMRPELYTAYLQCSSQWDGNYSAVVKSRTPVYFVIGENDEYYGSEPSRRAYNEIRALYKQEGLSDNDIDRLLVLDIKPTSYFTDKGVTNQHGYGGMLFVRDSDVMNWLFGQVKTQQ